MRTHEIIEDDGKVLLLIGDTKGGLTLLHIETEHAMTPDEARELGEELIRAADEVQNGK